MHNFSLLKNQTPGKGVFFAGYRRTVDSVTLAKRKNNKKKVYTGINPGRQKK